MSESAVSAPGAVRPVEAIRAQFPALRREHRGQPVAYFDGPGGTQVPEVVADRMRDYLLNHNANTHWAYPTQRRNRCGDRGRPAGTRRLPRLIAGRGRVRRQHDDPDLSRQPGPRARVAGGRRGDRHRTRSSCQRRSVARRRARSGIDRPHGPVRHQRPASSIGRRSNARSRPARDCSRLAPPRTRWVRSPTWPRPRVWRTTPERSASLTRCTMPRTPSSTFVRSAAICSPVRRTSSTVRTSARCTSVRISSSGSTCPRSNRPRTMRRIASRPARSRTRRSSAPPPPSISSASLSPGTTVRRDALQNTMAGLHERNLRQVTRLWTALRELPGVSVYGPPPSRPRTSTLSFVLAGVASTDVARHCASARAVRIQWRFLRPDRGPPPWSRGRRARPPGLCGLYDRRRSRARDRRDQRARALRIAIAVDDERWRLHLRQERANIDVVVAGHEPGRVLRRRRHALQLVEPALVLRRRFRDEPAGERPAERRVVESPSEPQQARERAPLLNGLRRTRSD